MPTCSSCGSYLENYFSTCPVCVSNKIATRNADAVQSSIDKSMRQQRDLAYENDYKARLAKDEADSAQSLANAVAQFKEAVEDFARETFSDIVVLMQTNGKDKISDAVFNYCKGKEGQEGKFIFIYQAELLKKHFANFIINNSDKAESAVIAKNIVIEFYNNANAKKEEAERIERERPRTKEELIEEKLKTSLIDERVTKCLKCDYIGPTIRVTTVTEGFLFNKRTMNRVSCPSCGAEQNLVYLSRAWNE